MTSHDHPPLRFRAEAHSGGELSCLVRHGDVPQQQLCRLQNAGGIGVVSLTVGDESGGGAVDEDPAPGGINPSRLERPAVPKPQSSEPKPAAVKEGN